MDSAIQSNNLKKRLKSTIALITAHGWVGISTPVIMTASFLAQQGFGVDLFISEDQVCKELKIDIPKLDDVNINIIVSREKIDPNATLIWQRTLRIRSRDSEFAAKHKMSLKKYDWLIGFDPYGLIRAGLLSFYWNVPYVYHSLELYDQSDSAKEAECWFSQRAILTLTQDRVRAEILAALNKIDKNKIAVSYNSPMGGVLKQKKNHFRKTFKLPEHKKIALATGTLLPIHSVDRIIDSLPIWPDDWVLVLHGWIPDQNFASVIQSKIELHPDRLFLSTDIMPADEKDIIFQSADAGFVFFEPISTNYKYAAGSAGKLYDLMRAGVPIIGNDIPGMRALLETSGCGLVVEDERHIGDALARISSNYSAFQENCLQTFPKYEFGQCYRGVLKRIIAEVESYNQKKENRGASSVKALIISGPTSVNEVYKGETTYGSDQLRESDILIASFPRSGNTWTRNLLTDIILQMHNIESDTNTFDDVEKVIPDIYLGKLDQIDPRLKLPFRLINSHEKFSSQVQKTIYVFRKASDALCSYYHFCVNFEGLDPSNGADDFCFEKCDDWIHHMNSYVQGFRNSETQICFVSYEWLHQDTVGTLMTMADFIGLAVNRQMCERAVENQKFLKHRKQSKTFYRKGVVGSSSEELAPTTTRRILLKSEPVYAKALALQTKITEIESAGYGLRSTGGLRVVHLCMQDFGGAGKAAYRLHKGLQSIGVNSAMLVLNKGSNDPSVKVVTNDVLNNTAIKQDFQDYNSLLWNQQLGRWNKQLSEYPARPSGLEMFTDAASDVRIDQISEIQEADIINLHWVAGIVDWPNALLGLKGKPIIWTLHDMNPFTGGCHYAGNCNKYLQNCGACPQLGSFLDDDLSRKIWRQKSDAYRNININAVTPSRWLSKCASQSNLFCRIPVQVIPNGIPLNIFKPHPKSEIRKTLKIKNSAKILMFGAQSILKERKGFGYLLAALNKIPLKYGHNVVLLTFGSSPGDLEIPSKYPVINLGLIEDENQLAMAYSAADVFLLPSLEDNLPNTVIEAMACGVPVVGFDIGGVSDMVEHKKTGYLVKPKDTKGLIEGIDWSLAFADNGGDFLKECRLKVEKEYSLKEQANAYGQLYRRLKIKDRNLKSKTKHCRSGLRGRISESQEKKGTKSIEKNYLAAPGLLEDCGKKTSKPFNKKHRKGSYPAICIVTPSYNQSEFLEECIDSILSQNYPKLEYIIMDGGSTDGSVDIIKKYDKYLTYWQSKADGGQYAAITEGFKRTTGEIMSWLNSDDKFHPQAFDRIAALFTFRDDVAWVTGRPNILDVDGRISRVVDNLPLWSRKKYLQKKYRSPFIQQEGTFWRRWLWEAAGSRLQTDITLAGDLELWVRFFRHAQLVSADALLAGYRQHSNQKAQLFMRDYLQEAEEIIDREIKLFASEKKSRLLPPPIPISKSEIEEYTGACESGKPDVITGKNSLKQIKCDLSSTEAPLAKPTQNILVSAVVSVWNSEKFIRGCLQDLLQQTLYQKGQLEIIVVDSGSSENEGRIICELQKDHPKIKYIRTEQRETVYQAWNRGIKLASGKYITNANTDDRHRQDAFERMANLLEMRPDVVLVYADLLKTETANETFENCTPVGRFTWYDWDRTKLLNEGCFIGPQPMWRRSVHDSYGYFDEEFVTSGDYEFWLRISQTNNFYHIREPLGLYMIRPKSIEHREAEKKLAEDIKIHSIYSAAEQQGEIIRRQKNTDNEQGRSKIHIPQQSPTKTEDVAMKPHQDFYQCIQPLLDNCNPEKAIAVLSNLVNSFPDFAQAHNDLGILFYRAGEKEKALKHYELAAELAPGNVIFQKNLALYYYAEQGRVEDALQIYVNLLERNFQDVEILLTTGHICASLQRSEDAIVFYKRVLEIDPGNPDARDCLANLQLNEGTTRSAI